MPTLSHVERAFLVLNQGHDFDHIDLMHTFGVSKEKAHRILFRAMEKQLQRDACLRPRIQIVAA